MCAPDSPQRVGDLLRTYSSWSTSGTTAHNYGSDIKYLWKRSKDLHNPILSLGARVAYEPLKSHDTIDLVLDYAAQSSFKAYKVQ